MGRQCYCAWLCALIVLLGLGLMGCGGIVESGGRAGGALAQRALSVDQVLALDSLRIGQWEVVEGDVDHACKRSGLRCFLSGEKSVNLRIEAGWRIGTLASDLLGRRIRVRGVPRSQKIPGARVDELEMDVVELAAFGEEASRCAAQLEAFELWRKGMEKHQAAYYPLHFVDGDSYEVEDWQ